MGTRSLTVFHEYDAEIVVMYRQYDGYPEGHGLELAEFLLPFTVVNGLGLQEERKVANGMGCLTAQVVAHFKEEAGNIYLYNAKTRNVGEEYIYRLSCPTKEGEIKMECWEVDYSDDRRKVFDGTPTEFITWVKETEEQEVA